MVKLQDDYRDLKTSYFSFEDILVLGLMIAVGLYFIITSVLKIAVFEAMNTFDLLANIMGIVVGYGLIFGAYKFVKRSAYLKAIADGIFVETIYDRLEPLLADIAETKAGYDTLSDSIDKLNYNMNDIRKSIELGKTNPSNDLVPIQYAIRKIVHQFQYTLLMVFTFGMYMFMFYNIGSNVQYIGPLVYVLWWALITSHHDLWEMPQAWYWVSIPILFIPIYTIIYSALYSANDMLLLMYLGLGAYVLLYYTWCEYKARGILPFGIGERLHDMKTMLKESQSNLARSKISEPTLSPPRIGIILILFSVLLFALSMLGYLIENKLLNISWQTFGFEITWQPLYFYGLLAVGTLLLVTGSFFVVKFREYQ